MSATPYSTTQHKDFVASELEYYIRALTNGATMEARSGKERTVRPSYCDVCRIPQGSGSPKFWFKDGTSCYWFYPCEKCLESIQSALTKQAPVGCDEPTGRATGSSEISSRSQVLGQSDYTQNPTASKKPAIYWKRFEKDAVKCE